MAEALIQIVDKNDQPVRGATREEAWQKGLIHRIVFVIVRSNLSELLLQKRPDDEAKLWPNLWTTSASGHVDLLDDGYRHAALRELHEEVPSTRIAVSSASDLKLIGKFYWEGEFEGRILNRFNAVYETEPVDRETIDLRWRTSEVAELGWFSLQAAKDIAGQPDKTTPILERIMTDYYG